MKSQKKSMLKGLQKKGSSKHFVGIGLKKKPQIITASNITALKEHHQRLEARERKLFEEAIDKEFLYLQLFDQ
ncbi:MAG: hypothetical protein NXH90_01870 [Flavobacteriaceae bacterium]|nr:hypothetical protein [Flavobacteriaceae bacterium]